MKYRNIHYKLSKNSLIMLVGINPHNGSYRRGVPFSNNKMFWYLLSRAGIIDEPVVLLRDDAELKKMYENRFAQVYRLNFINLVDRPTVDVSELKKGEETYGIKRMLRAVKSYKPRLVCFVGKVTYEKFCKDASAAYGYKGNLFGSKVYLCHFPIRGPASVRIKELKKVIRIAKALDQKNKRV
jgi:TDG/mug DNA glycosylase family protein